MSKKIVIIDDDKTIHEKLNFYLKKLGYETYNFYNLQDAFFELKKINPILIILDVMPKICCMLKKIKNDEDLSHIPIIVFSSIDLNKYKEENCIKCDESEDCTKCKISLFANEFFLKTEDLDLLALKITNARFFRVMSTFKKQSDLEDQFIKEECYD